VTKLVSLVFGAGLLLAGLASGWAAEQNRKALIITYSDGKRQTVNLEQPSCNISQMEFQAGTVQGQTYTDEQGNKVTVACGALAFADRVAQYKVGNPAPAAVFANPRAALGEPDYHPAKEGEGVTLGCGGSLTLEFTRVSLVDIDGPDLHVFEVGPAVEPMRLEISKDGITWIDVGRISGGKAAVDIRRVVSPGDQFRYVRLTDLKEACGGRSPGADIDAVAAIGCAVAP
jgi:hypothetical protein